MTLQALKDAIETLLDTEPHAFSVAVLDQAGNSVNSVTLEAKVDRNGDYTVAVVLKVS
ncbi:MAG: hypothetical protein ACYS7Y_34850 [Planctomycetota bacterium]|jgi:hypothetical protein